MPGIGSAVARELLHTRAVEIRGYRREDGHYDIEGHLVDTKPRDFQLASGVRAAGKPVHDMWLRITVDSTLTIVDAAAAMDAIPFVDHCGAIVPAYRKLVGLAIRPGYHNRVKELLGGIRGCTHVTELAGALATAAFQTLAGHVAQDPDRKPFQVDRCHALDASGAAVARYYPRWSRGSETAEKVDGER
jgi:hypothetical protein